MWDESKEISCIETVSFLTHDYCIFCCASPLRKSRLWTLWDPLRIRVPQDEVEADYMQHSQVPHILHPVPVMVARLPSALHLRFILFKEGFKGFPFVCPPACDRVSSLAAIDPNIHCGRNNTCLVLPLSYRNILNCARTYISVQNSMHLLSNLSRELISHHYYHWFPSRDTDHQIFSDVIFSFTSSMFTSKFWYILIHLFTCLSNGSSTI